MIAAPEAFKQYPQFILWKPVIREDGKVDKVPINHTTFDPANPHDRSNWIEYNVGATMSDLSGYGLGFVFTANDPFFFLDIDHSLVDGQWSQLSQELCGAMAGCAVEISYSGTGLHVFGSGQVPLHGCKNIPRDLELYTQLRFVALTGMGLVGDASTVVPAATLNSVVEKYFPVGEVVEAVDWSNGPCAEWAGPEDDLKLIEKMLKSRSMSSVFSGRASIHDLWVANESILCNVFPSQTGKHGFDQSSADMALCSHLAFWTGKDCARMDRIFRLSSLYRDKWENRDKYGQTTILKAIGRCRDVLGSDQDKSLVTEPSGMDTAQGADTTQGVGATERDVYKSGYQLLTPTQQLDHFKGCVYVRDMHRIFTPDGAQLKPEQFNAMMGGHVMVMDSANTKTSKKAWEVFTESQAINFPKVFGACFRPERPSGEIITEEGGSMVNTYVPAKVERKKGDATPFLVHLAKLLPDERDREILLSYMAACVQYVGVKFQWCPLIQGAEGNGKTLLANCLAKAIGWKYTHTPNANDLANKFNSWILGKLLIIVEEIYVNDRKEAIETLKPLITNPIIEIQGKGTNQATGDNRANFFMCTNHKDAIRKSRTDRRYCVFYTNQQGPMDLHLSGMDGDYFPDLYDWLRKVGYAIVTDYLMTYNIPPEFNPAKQCQRAPRTTSTNEALLLSLGGLEQEILEAVDEDRYGFAKGWISSLAFNNLLRDRRDEKRIPPNKRREIIKDLGYLPHPNLIGGRVNNKIPKESGKPILYLKINHPALQLTKAPDIVRAYQTDQETK